VPDTLPLPPELAKTLEACVRTLSPDLAATIGQNPASTITPAQNTPDPEMAEAMALLDQLGPELGSEKALEIEGTLGEGGMGVVRLATQRSVGRKVAVKTLRAGVRATTGAAKLLHEGWTTGALEHPNVVPVYDIGTRADGAPFIVLKRIEGQDWSTLLSDAATVSERFGVDDLLEWNLRTLMQVCNAVHFAHSRGIVHRDLKPENVMIGAFGEVYVVDWGIAVSLRDDFGGRVPLASHATRLAGTPCYMAPEMLVDDMGALSERTDVYLLGAILFEVLAGHPPHTGKELMAIFSQVLISEPELPDGAPDELAHICRKAMSRSSDDRYRSAEELRLALQDYLSHAGSVRLARGAELSLERLLEATALPPGETERARLYDLLGECRFGFRSALGAWPENEDARRGLERAVVAMVDAEIDRGDPHAAELLLSELPDAPAAVRRRVDEARADKARAEQKAEAQRELGASLDPMVGRRTRVAFGVTLGILWTFVPLLGHVVTHQGHEPSAAASIGFDFLVLGTILALFLWGRESMTRSRLNHRVVVTLAGTLGLKLGLDVWNLFVGGSARDALLLATLLFCTAATISAVHLGWKLLPVALAYFGVFVFGKAVPDYVFLGLAGANAIFTLSILWIWLPNRKLGRGFWGREDL